jgi:hypothetical protein
MSRHVLVRILSSLVLAGLLVLLLAPPPAAARPIDEQARSSSPRPSSIRAEQAEIEGCSIFPADNIWNAPVDELPVDARSRDYVETIGAGRGLKADFGSGRWNGGRIGIPYVTVGSDQPRVALSFRWPDESDAGPYPIPTDAPIEGPPDGDGDRHILVLDRDACLLYEVYASYWQPDGSISAGSGAIFDLRSNALRPDGWTSADAAGLPILPGLVRYDEVASGEIDHAIRFTVPQTRRAYVWPGRHYASPLLEERYPPMGQRFRLKASVPIDGYAPEVQTILRAMKRYGIILADNGSAWFVSGVPDERWDNDQLRQFSRILGSDFEAVDSRSLMIEPDSGRVRGAAVPTDPPSPEPSATPTESPSPEASPTARTEPTAAPPTAPPTAEPTVGPPSASATAPAITATPSSPQRSRIHLPFLELRRTGG